MISKYKKWFGSPSSKESGIQGEEDNILLIEGTFNPVEAADVLLSLVSYKIKFHNLQLLNIDQITEESREQSEKRIAELKKQEGFKDNVGFIVGDTLGSFEKEGSELGSDDE